MALADKLRRVMGTDDVPFEDAVRVAAEDDPKLRRFDGSVLPDIAEEHPELDSDELPYAQHMAARERAFLSLLGPTDPPNQILSPSDPQLMVNWPGGGLHKWRHEAGWRYATHGLAQPDDPAPLPDDPTDAWSGLGVEYLTCAADDAGWPIAVLLHVTRVELFAQSQHMFSVGSTMPTDLGGGITRFFGSYDESLPHELLLPGGRCTLVHLVGITDAEWQRLRAHDDRAVAAGALIRVLRRFGANTVTQPGRRCITEEAGFEEAWTAALRAAVA